VWQPPGFTVANFPLRTSLLFSSLPELPGIPVVSEEEFYGEMFKIKSVVQTRHAREGLCGSHLFADTRAEDQRVVNTVLFDHKLLRGCG